MTYIIPHISVTVANEPPFMHGHGGDFITKGVGNGESWSTKDETPQAVMLHIVYVLAVFA